MNSVSVCPSKVSVAILLATYNGAAHLHEFLESLVNQTLKDFVLYVRDDCSTDATVKIFETFANRLNIHLIPSTERLGAARSFFMLMQKAEASHDIFMFADQDDYWYEDKVARAAAALKPYVGVVALYCTRLEYVDADLKHLKYSPLPRVVSFENAAVQNIATGCTVAITRLSRAEILAGRPRGYIMHDWWLYLYCSAFGHVLYDPTPSIKYRQHGGNVIGAATSFHDELWRRLRRFFSRNMSGYLLSNQIAAFVECYGESLDSSKLNTIRRLIEAKDDFSKRISLVISPGVARQSSFDSVLLRILFLLGRY